MANAQIDAGGDDDKPEFSFAATMPKQPVEQLYNVTCAALGLLYLNLSFATWLTCNASCSYASLYANKISIAGLIFIVLCR